MASTKNKDIIAKKTDFHVNRVGRPPIDLSKITSMMEDYLERWKALFPEDSIPTEERFALWCGTDPITISEKANNNKAFSKVLRRMYALQKLILANNGVNKGFDSGMSKFLLSAVHGMREQKENDNQTNIMLVVNGGKSTIDV